MESSFKNVLSLFSANIVVKALGIFSVMVLIRFLTKEELSLLPNYAVVAALAITVSNFGIFPTLIREIPLLLQERKFAEARAMINTSLLIILPVLTIVSAVSYVFSEELASYLLGDESYTLHFKIMAVSFVFSGIRQFFDYGYWAYNMFKEQSHLLFIEGLVKVVLNIVGVIFFGALGLVVSLALTSLVSCFVSIYYFRSILFAPNFRFTSVKKLLLDSAPYYLEGYLMYFRTQGDQLFVSTFLGPEKLAFYFVAKKLYDILQIFTQPLDKVFTNSLAKLRSKLDEYSNLVSEIFTLNIYLCVPFFALCIGLTPIFINIIAGSGYQETLPTSILLTLTLLIYFLQISTFRGAIFLLKSPTSRFKLTIVESGSLAVFCLVLIHPLGVEGVALARLLTVLTTGFYSYYYTRQDISLVLERKPILVILVVSTFIAVTLLLAQSYSQHIILVGLVSLLVMSIFFVVINRSISKKYYSSLNTFLPFALVDPVTLLHDKFLAKKRV